MTTEPVTAPARVRELRPDIQALRALACLSIVIYHLWPLRLTGGYVGVDVFFVISGFLITAHLLREVATTNSIRLGSFWSRRARRLLPASLLVLAVTAVGIFAFVPMAHWTRFFSEIAASAFYVENWALYGSSTDYWSIGAAASPVQHYWSLSVEEQFYIVWPLLILLAWRFRAGRTRMLAIVLTVVSVLSFAYCVYETATAREAAYFVTPARVWEFGAGALLSIAASKATRIGSEQLRTIVAWLGWAALAVTLVTFNDTTFFPGYTAVLPVLGTAAVIWSANPRTAWAPTALSSWRPIQFAGDVSYSMYLWHWPLIVIIPFITLAPLTTTIKVAILVATPILGWATKRYVEDPARKAPRLAGRGPRRSLVLSAVGMLVITAIAGTGFTVAVAQPSIETQQSQGAKALAACFGAPAMVTPSCDGIDDTGTLYPAPGQALTDVPTRIQCAGKLGETTPICELGSRAPDAMRIALVGNSHAEVMLEALASTPLKENNWSVDTFIGRDGISRWSDATKFPEVQQHILDGPAYDVILVSYDRGNSVPTGGVDSRLADIQKVWKPAIDRGSLVIAVADNPRVTDEAIECTVRATTPQDAAPCGVSRDVAYQWNDPLVDAVKTTPGSALLDLGKFYCTATWCPTVIGNVIVYRDNNHLTATYAKTIAPYLVSEMKKIIAAHPTTPAP
ncbi:acyltransferase family protein [Glaciihabitans sp. dw_435]|uniref:acyltransferase family protein n=1 Tax=Glaciihabitans sp. dw_435 TaxID=2720081 RepID=UPI001BD5C1E4|nr:acyltransferase family protein [Glaciihabitans sp. dw_435]